MSGLFYNVLLCLQLTQGWSSKAASEKAKPQDKGLHKTPRVSFNLKNRRPGAKYSSPDVVPTDQSGASALSNTVYATHSALHPQAHLEHLSARVAHACAAAQQVTMSRQVLETLKLTCNCSNSRLLLALTISSSCTKRIFHQVGQCMCRNQTGLRHGHALSS